MSNGKKKKKKIRLEPAHKALGKLLAELETVDISGLPRLRHALQKTPFGWQRALERAHVGLREWCGSKGADGFRLELPRKK
jgi:hypothetical protein